MRKEKQLIGRLIFTGRGEYRGLILSAEYKKVFDEYKLTIYTGTEITSINVDADAIFDSGKEAVKIHGLYFWYISYD